MKAEGAEYPASYCGLMMTAAVRWFELNCRFGDRKRNPSDAMESI